MHTLPAAIVTLMFFAAAAGCCKSGSSESAEPSSTSPTATQPPAATEVKRFEGTYQSNWGSTVFTERGTTVTATYPRGSMTCAAAGDVLTCDWVEGTLRGKARLTRQSSGDIIGTWGNGQSATDGGPWSFRRAMLGK